jgi:type II protein arginine methyltransferase
LHARGGEAAYAQYVRHLESTSSIIQAAKKEGTVENFAQGYQDYLQAPLQVRLKISVLLVAKYAGVTQPLMDNLPSTTYHTFEQDPVKYRNYEEVSRVLSALIFITNISVRRYIGLCWIGLQQISC